ncbi:MAG: outer membrane protein assembly factor BamA [Rubricoccaceae bacterium]
MLRPSFLLRLLASALLAVPALSARAQQAPPPAGSYEVLAVTIEGAEDESTREFARQVSGLRVGQQVQLPWDEAFGEAVRNLYTRGPFSDAAVAVDQVAGQGVFLTVRVTPVPRLGEITYNGLSSAERREIETQVPLLRGRAVRPADIERGRVAITNYLRSRGFRLATVDVQQRVAEDGRLALAYNVNRGDRLTVAQVIVQGNEAVSDNAVRRRLRNTPERRWWRFWKRETFDEDKFEQDLAALVRYYNDRGHFGARVVRDTVYTRVPEGGGRPELVVEVEIDEGPRYHVRNVVFEGNTVFTDDQLRAALGIQRGDVFNRTRLERNLYYTQDHSDVSSLYSDRGYLRFDVQQQIVEVPGDSLDLYFEVSEGDVYDFGQVQIAGNTRTKEHVIRRELRTVPGDVYSRQAIERSVRELIQLNYFDQAAIGQGPAIAVNDEDRTVDLTYRLTETSSDQLELSGGWGGAIGLLLTARVTFNNFSAQNIFNREAWRPLPAGDGQQLALQVVTSGRQYQNYSLSFTEPWFRGRQTPIGFSVGYSDYNLSTSNYRVARGYGNVFYRQRLTWPDDFFQTGTSLGYQLFNIAGQTGQVAFGLPEGISQELTLRQTLSRNALNSPIFPSAGSSLSLGAAVAVPLPGLVQYYKLDAQNAWYTPVAGRLSLGLRTQFGYIGSITGEQVQFQRFLVGGSPLETGSSSQARGFGKDLIFLRGYPLEAIGPRRAGGAVGGRILNKYQLEAQLVAVQTPQLSFAPYLFVDAANTWDGLADYNPADLYRSAGFGARVFLPILGLVDLNYGYQIDRFAPLPGQTTETGLPQWRFQLSLGGQ